MRLSVSRPNDATLFYVIYVYGKRLSKGVERLGTEAQLRERRSNKTRDPIRPERQFEKDSVYKNVRARLKAFVF